MAVLVSDSFNRTNSTSLGTTDSNNGGTAKTWSMLSGADSNLGIKSNQAYSVTSAGNGIAVVNAGVSDCAVSANFYIADTSSAWLDFRSTSESNHWFIELHSNGNFVVAKNVNGNRTDLLSKTVTYVSGAPIKVVLQGSSIQAFYNNVSQGTVTDAFNSTVTNHGLGTWSSTVNTFDNFEIDDLATGGTGTTYTGAGTAQGTSNLSATEKKILFGTGTIQGLSSLTTTEKRILNVSGTVLGYSSLSSGETIILHTGTTYTGGGIAQGQTILTAQDILKFAENGTTQGISLVSGNTFLLLKENGSSLGQSSLFASEIFISGRGTIYSEGGISQGYSLLITNERMIHAPIPIPMIHLNGHIGSIIQLKGYVPSVIQLKGNVSSMIQLKGGKP